MTRRRALVTGGCGFVGRHFARRLLDDGYAVTIVDDLSTGVTPDRWPDHLRPSAGLASALTVHHADFRDYARDTVPAFDLILHLAAVVGGRMTIEGDPLRVATDLAIDAVFFNWLARHHSAVRKVLYFSSSAAYPVSAQGRRESRALAEEEIDFEATNGGVVLKRVGGAVHGSTTNGGLVIELAGDRWDGETLDVSTTNGGVIMSVPENYSAHLQTGTVNGSVNVDFPVNVQGRLTKQVAFDLGSGGATVKAMTTNGGVHLKRLDANE